MATLSQLKQQYTYKTGVSSLLTENQRQTIMTHLQEEEEARKNQGGFFGGIGYAFEKLGLGFLSSIEGIWDYTAGGLAKLFGADEWAEQQFANDWVNYNHADEWFNPSEGWQFVGDVAGGIGTSLPAIATVVAAGAIAVASGGTLSPVAAALISGAVAGLGAAGNATKQAYRETGELGGKEFGYGALVGITEGAVEGLSAGIGAGTGQIVKGISKSFGKEVAETVTRQTIGKAMIKGFIGEAFEEGLSEILDPVWARMTYDPNAKNATLQEVGYAALVGGLSGAIMGGVDVSIRNVHSMSRGSTIVKEGKSSNVISMAEQLSTYESENHTGYEQFEMVNTTLKELQTSMQKTNGEIRTAKQRMLLGVLEQANTTAAFTPFIARSAENIVNNADVIAEKLTAYGIKDAQGNPVTFTAEQIRSGVDTKNTSTFVNALKTNSVLRALAVADATGRLSMDTAKFKDATLRGQQLSTQADLNQFIENATDVERQAVGERLGISDWNTLTNEQFQQKIVEFSQNGGVEAYQQEQATVRELQNIDPATAKKMPARLNLKKDGTVRYTNGAVNIAVTKNGDTYRIYDYDSGKYSKPLTQAEANRTIREIKKAQAAAPAVTPATVENQQATDTQGTQQQTAPQNGTEQQGAVRKIAEQLNSERQQTQEIDTYARKNVSDYAKLNEPNKSIIRSVIRQGRAAGIADADVLSYARVAAHTGINVVFDKSLCAVAVNSQTGEKIYSDGYYDPETNRFVVNPETTRTHEALLLHELTHAIYRTADGKLILERGVKNMSQAEKDAIIKRYSDVGHGGAIELMDEINAHYAEGVLTNKNTIEKLVAEKPKLKDRILSFFKKSSTAYEGDTKLSKSAKSLYNRYKKLFDSFSERNRQYNAAEYRHTAPNAETRYALQEALQQLGEYDETRKRHIESREGDTISRNYGDIVEFIKTAKRLPPVKRLHIGIISDATAKLVKTKTDVDIKNYDFVLASNFISHIFDSHGTQRTEMPRNQKAVTYANIENIIETVIAPDDVTLASDENGTALKFIKELDGKNVALTITSTKKSTLTLKSAWIIENSEGRTPSANATASARTSETSGRNLTTDSISENGKKVNRNGKKDGKKRYALTVDGENITGEVEQTKNLVALHNLSETSLLKVLQLGGFPMPSIAITKVDMGHSEYGDITVVFGRDTIDPQRDRRNKIYSRDGWTPTAPKVEYKPNDRALSKIHKKYSELVSKVGYDATRVLYNYVNDIERQLELHGGEIGIISELYDNTELMNLFLVDTGGELIKPIYKTIRSELSAGEVTYRKRLIDALGKDFLAEFEKTSGNLNTRKDFVKQHKERIVNALATIMQGKESIEETRENITNNFSVFALGNTLNKATSYLNNGGISVSTEYDATATQETIRKATSKREYVSWVDKLFGGIEEKTGIYNGRDPYTNSGSRRSFEALHYEYTLENMVEAMLNAPENGGSGWHGLMLGQLQAKLAKEFKSIDEIRLNADNLTVKDEAAHEEFSENTRKMLSEITALMVDESKYGSDNVAYWTALDSAEMVVGEIADNRLFTLEKIAAYMKREYSKSYRYNDSIGNKILGLFEYVRRENDTDYFEAKPRRAVALTEIKRVLLPETASEKLIKELTARNIPYQIYDSSENARAESIKQMDGIRFALPETDSQGRTLTAAQREFFKNSKIVDNKGRLIPVYHGTTADFTEFRRGDIGYHFGTYKQARSRISGEKGGKRIVKAYLNITNPLTIETDFGSWEGGYAAKMLIENEIFDGDEKINARLREIGKFDTASRSDTLRGNKELRQFLQELGYDGIKYLNYFESEYAAEQYSYIAFSPNQIKLTSNESPTIDNDIRFSRRNKPIDGQMDIFRDIIGVQETTHTEARDSDYTKQAKTNADNIIKQLKERGYEQVSVAGAENNSGQGRSGASGNRQGSRVLDFGAVRRLFEGTGARTQDDSRLYSKIVRELNGYSYKRPLGTSGWKFGVVNEEFFTYDMFRIADTNRKNGVGTVFYLDHEIYKGGRKQGYTAGLYFNGGSNVYVSATQGKSSVRIPLEVKHRDVWSGRITYRFDYVRANLGTNSEFVATRGSENQSRTTTRHERLHLIYDAAKRGEGFSQNTYNAVSELKQFVKQQFAGRTDDIHRSIKDYYVKELGYGKVEQAIEEIACDLYAEDLVLNDTAEQAIVQKYIETIDKTLTDIIGKDGIRYAINPDINPTESDNSGAIGGLTRGQRAKFVANNTKFKVYSKLDATSVIDSIIAERLTLRDGQYEGVLSGKNRAEVIEKLFTKLNSTPEGYRIGVALDIADYIINNAVLTDMYDSYDDVSYAMETLSVIRRYMHKVDLRGIKGEIQHKFDKKNAVSLVWGAKQGGMAPDVIAQELQSYGINIEAINEADQFFEMLEIYEKAKSDVSKKAEKVSLTAYGSKTQIEKLRQQIARDILTAYDEKGTQSKYGKLVEKYTNQIESLTKQVRQARKINSVVNSLVDSAQYLRDIAAKRNYVGAEVFSAPELTSWLKNLGKLKYRSDLRKSGARKILLDYGKFYNTNNPLLYDADPNLTYIDNNVLDALNFLQQNADSTKPLSLEELQAAQVIMASAKHLFQNYDQMTMEGKKVRISEAATAGNAIIQRTKSRVGRGFFNSIYGVFNKIVEPRVVIKSFENYDPNGILTRAYNEITRGETAASLQYIQLVEKFDDYFKTNKKYRKRLTSEYITVAGAELNVGQALSLYELSKREQAKAGLYEAGFSYIDKKGKKQTVSITESDIDALQSAFTESDKQFISIVEEFFNVQSKKVKTDADLQILGYTNASDDFYFPIQRDKGTIAKNITDARDLMADWANVYNFSFNKDVKTGAKNKIFVPEIWSVITRHAKQLSTYAHLTVPLKNFSQIYAKNIGDKTHVQSIRNTLNEQVWGGADAYLSKLFADIQGKATSSSVIEKLRGAYAKYQLGANLKVIVSQLTSYPTAGIELDFRSMVKGAVMKTDYAAMDKYCDYARVRNYEKGVVRAEGVIDKVGKVGDIFTKPIQWTDRAAIGKIWNACQVQIERNDGHKIGTVENMQAAGVLLEEVIRLTQPNYTNTERSALMRSDSDIVRSFTMFTSVPLKQLSRLVESVGEYKTLRQMIKSGDTNADIQSRYKKAKKRLGKTLASITVANLMYTMVAQFFKWLYAKDRKDKDGNEISFVQDFFTDFASTTIGMFPVVKDIYNYFANDYEFSNFAYDSINSILSTTKDLFEVATKAAGGESLETSDYMKPLRNSLYAIGQITGLPIRNINNTISGVIKRFSPATAYKYNSMFYNAQYSKDIKAALANGDTELADTIMSLMLDEDKAGNLSAGARKKLIELYEQEYEVLPRSIGDSVTYNGEKIELTAKQREKFKRVYGKANGYIERMVQNKSFAKLSANKQAKAIKQVYDAYYDKALAETLGVSSNNKLLLLSKFMGIESLSIALAGISDITSDKDKNGATVQGSKKKKVIQYLLGLNFTDAQRLLILFMQGYKIGDGEYKRLTADRAKRMVISYILSLNKATQAEKAQLAQMCGVEVKNGRIVTKSLYAAK